ncbi:efflux RND transporter periplasmic adaptor subunit [Corallincola platygyrae]|uniref:Efflux RND transporter periplasmic adaptor subunit n=1 Tax=Corallincola platygyrae TaxID=1193278 RepID=A0ABW4XRF2_9GAMM
MIRIAAVVLGILVAAGAMFLLDSENAQASHDETAPAISVRVEKLNKASIAESVPLQGTVFSHHAVNITPEVDGRITAIYIESGQEVERGQLLLQLDDRHEQATVRREQAKLKDDIRRQKQIHQLAKQHAVSTSEVDAADAQVAIQQAELALAKAALEDRAIRAPFRGNVGLVDLSVGKLVNSDTVLTTLDDTSQLKMNVSVPAKYQHRIQKGTAFALNADALQARSVVAKLAYIDSRVSDQTLNMRLQLTIDNHDNLLLPGTFLTGDLPLAKETVVSLPLQAVAYEGHQRFAYRLNGDHVEKVEIELGARNSDFVEVVTGLKAGDEIVTEGLVKLRDGVRVQVIEHPRA